MSNPTNITRYSHLVFFQTPVAYHETNIQVPAHLEFTRPVPPCIERVHQPPPAIQNWKFSISTPPKHPEERSAPGKIPINSLIHSEDQDLYISREIQLGWTPEMKKRLLELWKNKIVWRKIAADLQRTELTCKNQWHRYIKPQLPEYKMFKELNRDSKARFNAERYTVIHNIYFKKSPTC